LKFLIRLTQEPAKQEAPAAEKKKAAVNPQEVVDSLRSIGDDIGQISELSSEEKVLVGQFFTSLYKMMSPLAPSIQVNPSSLPPQVGDVTQAYIDPTGHLVLQYTDGHVELRNLNEEKNRDLMMAVVGDVVPKFKSLTAAQKRKLENRIKMLSSVTKEIQKSSDALSAAMASSP
jgi:hypothetical protein